MAAETDLFLFLKTRNITDSVISQLKDDKIDIDVIDVMTDEELGQYIKQYGDRLALRAFCRQRTVTNEKSGGVETVKSALMQRVRDRLGEHRKTPVNRDTEGSGVVGNKHAPNPSNTQETPKKIRQINQQMRAAQTKKAAQQSAQTKIVAQKKKKKKRLSLSPGKMKK
ncbi:hypothetical protein PAMA_006632 [Pampus argenteus]